MWKGWSPGPGWLTWVSASCLVTDSLTAHNGLPSSLCYCLPLFCILNISLKKKEDLWRLTWNASFKGIENLRIQHRNASGRNASLYIPSIDHLRTASIQLSNLLEPVLCKGHPARERTFLTLSHNLYPTCFLLWPPFLQFIWSAEMTGPDEEQYLICNDLFHAAELSHDSWS